MEAKFILIEPCNFMDYPVGGILSFAKQLIDIYGNKIALVGLGERDDPTGIWFKKTLNNQVYNYFAISEYYPGIMKPIIPARLQAYLNIKKYKNEILSAGLHSVFVQSHEILKAVTNWKFKSVCYYFPGVGSPLQTSRYPWARIFSKFFDYWFLSAALKADVLLAAADSDAIMALKNRCRGILKNKKINFFSTRVNTNIFKRGNKFFIREGLGLSRDTSIFVTTGRIHYAKGWDFLLEAIRLYKIINSNCLLIFVGDGDDRKSLEIEISKMKLNNNVMITGFLNQETVAKYIQAADVFLLGSKKEGWSTSLIEALACYKPIVTCRVSSATSIVKEGINGFVVEQNDLRGFVSRIEKALVLGNFDEYIDKEIAKYSLDTLKRSLEEIWNPDEPL
jgi:glycosyltransferase involved in cell wall biosynthesis